MVVAVTCRRAASFTAASGGGSSRSGIGGSSFVAALESMRYPSAFSKSCYSGFGDGRVSSRGRRGIALSEFVSRGWGAMIGRTLEASGRRTRGKSTSLALLSGVERIDKKKIRSGGGTFFSSSAVLSGGSSMPSPSVVEAKRSPGMTANINKSSVELPSNESSEKLVRIRHSCAHVMAMAVQRLFPAIQVGVLRCGDIVGCIIYNCILLPSTTRSLLARGLRMVSTTIFTVQIKTWFFQRLT